MKLRIEASSFQTFQRVSPGTQMPTKPTSDFCIIAHNEPTADTVVIQPELKLARSQAELEDAFQLVYESYLRAGLTPPNSLGLRLTPYHLLPTTDVVLAKISETLVATASVIVDGELGLPAESIYAREIDALRRRGLRIAEIGCLADRRKSPSRFIQTFRQMATLIAQTAKFRGCNALIAATHPAHARFYIRQLGFQQVGELQACPYAQGNPAVALLMDFEQLKGSVIHEHLFGKEYSEAELQAFDWNDDLRSYFTTILQKTLLMSLPPTQASGVGLPASAPLLPTAAHTSARC